MADLESCFSTEQPQQATSAPAVSQPPPVSAVSVSEEQPLLTPARPSQAMPVVAYPCQTPPSADQASRPIAAYSPPHPYQGQQPNSTAFGGLPGGASFDQNTQILVMASLSILSGVIGLVTCILEATGVGQLNHNDDDYYDDHPHMTVGPGVSAGLMDLSVAIFAAIVLVQVMRYRTYGQDAVTVKRTIACQVVVLTNWMGFLALSLPIAATFSAMCYHDFPGVVNCALLSIMTLLNLAGAVIGCFTTCSTQCGGCCTCEGCFANPSAGIYQRLVNDGHDGPVQTRAYSTFASDMHVQAAPPPSNPNTWQQYQQQTPRAQTNRSSDGVWPRPGTIQVAQPISHAQIPHALNGQSSDGVLPRPGTIPVAQPIHSHAQPSSQTSTLAAVETTSDNPDGGPTDALGEDGQLQ